MNPEEMSDDELMKFAGISPDITDQELMSIAGLKSQGMPHPENILQRVARKISEISPQQAGYEIIGGTGPLDLGQGLGMMATGNPFSKGLNKTAQAEGIRKTGAGGNIALDILSDPMTYGGLAEGGSMAKSGAKKIFPYTSKESRVAFTNKVEKSLIKRRGALTRGFGSELNKSKAIVDLSDILDEGSEITTFTMKEAQDLKNAISSGIPDAVKKGVRIDPKHFGSREIAGKISQAMKKADPNMAKTIEKYGQHAENFKDAIGPIKSSRGPENVFGSSLLKQAFGVGGSIPEKSQVAMQEFAPRVSKSVKGAKTNENIFRALRGGAISGAAYKFVPDVLKRTFIQEVSK